MIQLSESQKYHIIAILRDLASVDRNIDLLEAIRIRLIGLKMDLHAAKIDEALAEDLESIDGVKKRLENFPALEQKKYLYQQCVLLLLANRELTGEERKALDEVRRTLGLDDGYHRQVVDWVEEGMAWERRGEDLVGGALAD